MQWYDRKRQVKILLVTAAITIAVGSLVVSNSLVRDLEIGERQNMEVWAEAMRTLNNADEMTDVSLVLKVLNGNQTIPVIVLDKTGEIQSFRNVPVKNARNEADTLAKVQEKAEKLRESGRVIRIYLDEGTAENPEPDYMEICYDESLMLKRLTSYPYIELCVVLIFVIVAIFALLTSKRAEQNKVWVGLSKETAHQLGTPISSLLAWAEILKENYPDDKLIPEMDKDVKRLEMIADRFSKIGSKPELKTERMSEVLRHVIAYMARRTSNKVKIECRTGEELTANICAPLFEWVIENLCKNAVDAMDGEGKITVEAFQEGGRVVVEVSDTGKGIPKNHFSTVFSPGFTTKKRGWGLGLSLAKRIVEEYHKGKIFVKRSEIGVGTTFRVELRAQT